MTINIERVRLWVDDLRNTQERQTTGQLWDGDGGFCCLGRACDISGMGEWKENEAEGDLRYVCELDDSATELPYDVAVWFGFIDDEDGEELVIRDPVLKSPGGDMHDNASCLNDTWGLSFEEIAYAIEATWPEVKR